MSPMLRGATAVSPLFLILAVCAPAFACDYPDQGNMPLRRAVGKVKFLPETEAWAESQHKAGAVVQYAVLLDKPKQLKGRCYWPVEVRAGSELWRRYYVSPDGKRLVRP